MVKVALSVDVRFAGWGIAVDVVEPADILDPVDVIDSVDVIDPVDVFDSVDVRTIRPLANEERRDRLPVTCSQQAGQRLCWQGIIVGQRENGKRGGAGRSLFAAHFRFERTEQSDEASAAEETRLGQRS